MSRMGDANQANAAGEQSDKKHGKRNKGKIEYVRQVPKFLQKYHQQSAPPAKPAPGPNNNVVEDEDIDPEADALEFATIVDASDAVVKGDATGKRKKATLDDIMSRTKGKVFGGTKAKPAGEGEVETDVKGLVDSISSKKRRVASKIRKIDNKAMLSFGDSDDDDE